MKYHCNEQVFKDLIKKASSDDLDTQTIQGAIKDFKTYTKTVECFQQEKDELKASLNQKDFLEMFTELDKKRTYQHNLCLSDVSILNILSKYYGLDPFIVFPDDKDVFLVNRTDVADAIIEFVNKKGIES